MARFQVEMATSVIKILFDKRLTPQQLTIAENQIRKELGIDAGVSVQGQSVIELSVVPFYRTSAGFDELRERLARALVGGGHYLAY